MTLFLDSKENVLDVQLTPYGKYLLSIGKLQPDYYAFFDNGVMYDSAYSGIVEEVQNDVHGRIKESPQLEIQSSFKGAETEINKINQFIRAGGADSDGRFNEFGSKKIQPTPERHYSLTSPLGTISLESFSPPAWSIRVFKGNIMGAVAYQESDFTTLKIPQLTMDSIDYTTETKKLSAEEQFFTQTDLGLLVNHFKDGSYIDVTEDDLVIEVNELNTVFGNDNFEIEVFEVQEEIVSGITKENLIPMYFATKKKELVRNDILLDEDLTTATENIDASSVEYFLEVLVDDEVEDEEIEPIIRNLYVSDVREEEIKPC